MLENKSQYRLIISSVLNRTNFYFLPLAKLTEILKLLQMPETSQPNTILQYVFTGIIRLYQKYKQKIATHIFNEKFSSLSNQSKELLYSIFLHIHNQLSMKNQPTIPPSVGIPPYNMNMVYPNVLNENFKIDSRPNTDLQEVKKMLDTNKMCPYYWMNPQFTSSMMPSINPSMNPPSLNPSLSSHYGGLSVPISNPYMGYPGTSSMTLPSFGQIKNPPRNLTGPGIPFGIGSYTSLGPGSIYPPQYMPYSPAMIGGYGQTISPSFSHNIANNKSELNQKNTQISGSVPNQNFQKRYLSSSKNDLNQRNNKQKSLPKDNKFMPPSQKLPFNPKISNPLNGPANKPQNSKIIRSNYLNSTESLQKNFPWKDTKRLIQPNPVFKECSCKGFYEYQGTFLCSICSNKFHLRCMSLPDKTEDYQLSEITCAHCKMRTMDPLNKVQQTIGEFYLVNLFEKGFQSIINFKPYEGKCKDKHSKYEIEIRCIRTGEHMKNLQITWPDECQIKINNDKIVDIPALQSNSSLKKRKDYSVFITQNIFSKGIYMNIDNNSILQKVKISLELKPLTPQEANGKRIRNDFTFALGIYLVEKLNTDQLYAKIMYEEKVQDSEFLKNLLKTKQDQVQIDKITIRLTDPFSWDFIKTPVRGHKCSHAQCFDLKTFISLMYSAKNRTWKCPLCTREARKFMLDMEQMDLIKKAHEIDPIPKEVQIFKGGKVAFKIQKQSGDEDQRLSVTNNKTKRIVKDKKEEVIKQK